MLPAGVLAPEIIFIEVLKHSQRSCDNRSCALYSRHFSEKRVSLEVIPTNVFADFTSTMPFEHQKKVSKSTSHLHGNEATCMETRLRINFYRLDLVVTKSLLKNHAHTHSTLNSSQTFPANLLEIYF